MIKNLITIDDFNDPVGDTPYIPPNSVIIGDGGFGANTQVNYLLDVSISSAQDKVLRDLLGGAEYSKFAADYDENLDAWMSQQWIDFVEGVDYEVSDVANEPITIKWTGIGNVIKHFAYCEWLKEAGNSYDATGASSATAQGVKGLGKQKRFNTEYNRGVKKYGVDWGCQHCDYQYRMERYLRCGNPNWINWYYEPYYSRHHSSRDFLKKLQLENTAYNFMYYYKKRDASVFVDWNFTIKEKTGQL